jgi:hypothetical protein
VKSLYFPVENGMEVNVELECEFLAVLREWWDVECVWWTGRMLKIHHSCEVKSFGVEICRISWERMLKLRF